MSNLYTLAVSALLAIWTGSAIADCLSFETFRRPQPGDVGWDPYQLQLIEKLAITSSDIVKVQVLTEVSAPDPQNLGEIFEYLEGSLEADANADQNFIVLALSPRAGRIVEEASKQEAGQILRISRGDIVINEAVLTGGGSSLQFRVEPYEKALASAKLLETACD